MASISLTAAKQQADLQIRRQSVLECRNSGMTVQKWCTEHQIHPSTYYRWQKEVWDYETQTLIPNDQSSGTMPIRFAEISMPSMNGSQGCNADIVLKKAEWTVEIHNSVNSAVLEQVLRAVSYRG